MKRRVITVLFFFLLGFSISHAQAADKTASDTDSSRYVQVPVLYMTDRAIANNGYSNQRKYEEGSIYNVYF